uniref:Glutaredoxin and cysteine rich domain containing 2 n=1 Tax=Myripristis murdjan TaxID=586833 RepID=A0A667XGA6_9TELE
MEELQRKLNQRYEGSKPRKVRFKLASSYSGRVLKHVYEDGQELDSPEEKYPHSFIHRKIPPSHLEMEQLCGFEDINLRIIRAPPRKPDASRHHAAPAVVLEGHPQARERGRHYPKTVMHSVHFQITLTTPLHCGGSGCAPCSLCHGSKLSMLANRFNESISDLRCQACYPHGLEKCQSCSSK